MKIPLAVKLIVITIGIVVGVTLQITQISAKKFESAYANSEEGTNISLANSKAKEVENFLSNLKDKTTILALQLLNDQQNINHENDKQWLFYENPNLYSLEIKKISSSKPEAEQLKLFTNYDNLIPKSELFKATKDNSEITKLIRQDFSETPILKGNFVIKNTSLKLPYLNSSEKEFTLPMISIGFLFKEDTSTNSDDVVKYYVVAEYSQSVLQKTFSTIDNARIFYLVDKEGQVLAHPLEEMALKKINLNNESHKLITEATSPKSGPSMQMKYDDIEIEKDSEGKYKPISEQKITEYRGAYAKNAYGTIVVGQIPESVIKSPGAAVLRESFKIMGQILSVAIFLIFLFSNSISSPIEKLVYLTQQISKGNFDVNASKQVKSIIKDEVTDLAKSFDSMTSGLKERDKVKNLFSKFHGSKVAEDLLNKDIGIGGQNKEVIVFFSDIRGFTAFSEKRPPEEVVEMLNEYFGVMVKIINTHNGVVDKFIGDAIMAIWGAPKGSPQDAENAVRACIEMRKALQQLNEKRISQNQPPINIGMGLHAGNAISGTIGSNERMEYTVIGNTINTGSRIEASTKAFGADLLISDEVVSKIGDKFLIEMAGAAEVKGRSEALKLYKVRGFKDPATGNFIEVKTPYSDYEPEKADKVKVSA